MRLPINHIKTSRINKDTITSNSVSDFNSYRGIQLYQKCLRDENKYVQCYITYIFNNLGNVSYDYQKRSRMIASFYIPDKKNI